MPGFSSIRGFLVYGNFLAFNRRTIVTSPCPIGNMNYMNYKDNTEEIIISFNLQNNICKWERPQ